MGGVVAGAIFLLSLFNSFPTPQNEPQVLSSAVEEKQRPTPTPSSITYVIESGDTLYTIAQEYYGSQKYWVKLWNDNDWIEDPRLIRKDWELKISTGKQSEVEDPLPKLAALYEEITAPSPTPTPEPIKLTIPVTAVQGSTGTFDDVYRAAEARFGVPWEILYGLHQMETGGRDGPISSGYGTGAQGPLQFMPGTWALYGVDGNGDGAADINNAVDAIFGAANYLAVHGGVEQGLKSYGGDTEVALNYARSRGYSP